MTPHRTAWLPVASCHVAFAVVVLLLSSSAVAQRRDSAAGASSPPALIVGPLAERVLAETNFYLEMAGASTDSERAAVAELYSSLTTGFGGMTGGALPLTLEEFQVLAASNVAVGFRMPAGAADRSDFGWVAIIRTSSASTASALAVKFPGLFGTMSTSDRQPRGVTVRGRKVVPLTSSTSGDSPFYTVAGESILVGDRVSIERALGATAAAPSLATTELYRDGRARVGNDVGLFTLFKLPKELFGKPDPDGAEPSMATLIGAPSLRGVVSGSEPWVPEAPGTTVVAIDRDARNLLTILAGGPAVTLRPAQLLPSDTGIVAAFTLDLPAIESLLRTSKTAREAGFDIADIERKTGISFRDQLLPALGSEFAVGFRFESAPASMTMGDDGVARSSNPVPQLSTVVLVEVRQADVIRAAFEQALATTAPEGTSIRDVGGVRVASAGSTAVAVVDDVAVIGAPAEVERVLLTRAVEQTLGTSRELDEARGRLDANTIAIMHPTTALRDTLTTYASALGVVFGSASLGLSNLDDTVVRKEPLGIVVTANGGSAFSVAAIGIGAAIAIPSLISARGAADEAAAVGTLRSLGSAQATFHLSRGRYGTMAELVSANMMDSEFRNGVERNGYVFREMRPTATTFEFSAAPVRTTSRDRSYNIIEDHVIRSSSSKVPPRRKAGKPLGVE